MAAPSMRDFVRQSERAHGYNTALGSQQWAALSGTGPRRQPPRTTRQPTPTQALVRAPPSYDAAARQQAVAEETTPEYTAQNLTDDLAAEHEDEYDHDGGLDEHDANLGDHNSAYLRGLEEELTELREELAGLREELAVRETAAAAARATEAARRRRLGAQHRQLGSLSAGPYWITRSPRR